MVDPATCLAKPGKIATVEHHAAMDWRDLPAFVAELRWSKAGSARALEFAILTVARIGAVVEATGSEIDAQGRLWCRRDWRCPLSEPVMALVRNLPADPAARLFPINKDSVLKLVHRLRPGITTHGFRSTFTDWAHEQTDTPAEIIEMALAHASGDRVADAYKRSDLLEKRRQLAEAWAQFCGN
jgi:integrase